MVHAKLKLYNVGTSTFSESYDVDCNTISIGFNNQIVAKPSANGGEVVEVQKQSFENPTYVLNGVEISNRSGSLTYNKLLEWAKLDTTGDGNYLVLDVDYNTSSTVTLPDSAGDTDGIKVVIRSYNVSLGLSKYVDTNYRSSNGSITLVETK